MININYAKVIKSTLHILYLEDNEQDVKLAQAKLEEEGYICHLTHVETQADFVAALEKDGFDVILADYKLPFFDGLSALAIAREKTPELPFIFLTGAMGEEVAIETLRNGATDYVLKEHLSRLVPAIRRAMEEADEHLERRRAEKALEKLSHHNELILNSASEGIFGLDLNGNHTFVNSAAAQMLGYRVKDLIGKHGHEIWHHSKGDGSPYPEAECPVYSVCKYGIIRRVKNEVFWKKDGTSFPVAYTCTPILEGGKLIGSVVTFTVIRKRKREKEEEELRRHRQHLAEFLEERTDELRTERDIAQKYPDIAGVIFIVMGADQNVELINKKGCESLGYKESEIIGKNWFDTFVPAQEREKVRAGFVKLISGKIEPVEYFENSIITKSGTERLFAWHNTVLMGEEGNIIGTLSSGKDITDRRGAERELRHLRDELGRSNTDLQQFAAASHDLQEPLRVIAGFVKLLKKRYKDKLDAKADELFDLTADGVKRMQGMIKDLLEYSKVGMEGINLKPVDFSLALNKAVLNLKTAIEESGAIVTHDELPTVMADALQIKRLFQNLMSNAIKFHGKEALRVHISAERKDNEWVFSVGDNGIGIEPKATERIFVVFQRLHSKGEYPGTGIGLAICKRIIERHGGRIWVESEPGKGSKFFFALPAL